MEKIHKGGEVDMKNVYKGISIHLYGKMGTEDEWGPKWLIIDLRFRITVRVYLQVEAQIRLNFFSSDKLRRMI
jgi:hypothetical protein